MRVILKVEIFKDVTSNSTPKIGESTNLMTEDISTKYFIYFVIFVNALIVVIYMYATTTYNRIVLVHSMIILITCTS